jgi:hypothetical protein
MLQDFFKAKNLLNFINSVKPRHTPHFEFKGLKKWLRLGAHALKTDRRFNINQLYAVTTV